MKKYQRLLLIIVSITSVSLLLIYRQQYNRLRHVLEVFNFFGTPCNVTELQRSDGVLLEHDWGPQPIWQEVDSKGLIYSAFLLQKNTVEGLGIRHLSVSVPKTCFVFLEDDSKPIKGKLSVARIFEDKGLGFIAYTYKCAFTSKDKDPFAIAFKSQSGPKYVYTLISPNFNKKLRFNNTVCVFPSQFSKKFVLEFLSFHSQLGVESFIFYYDQSFSYNVMKLLQNFANTLNIWINFYPYNLPLFLPKEFTYVILEYDCRWRTQSQSKYSLTLGTNDYVVPSIDTSQVKDANAKLAVKKFCLNHVNKNRPLVLQNFELVDDHSFNEVLKVNKNDLSAVQSVFDHYCTIHRYEKCDKGVKTKTDFSMKKYSTDLTRSTLVQLLMHERI